MTPEHTECPTCAGCGRIANDDDRTPWKYWDELPVKSATAVILGLVTPVTCPDCGGTGRAIDVKKREE